MKKKDLIKRLEKVDDNATILVTSMNPEHNGSTVELKSVVESSTASRKKEEFKDMMDYTKYHQETWSIIGGDKKVVFLS